MFDDAWREEASGVDDLDAIGQGEDGHDGQAEGVELREDAEECVGGSNVGPFADLIDIGADVAMGEHDAFGLAAGAGGVKDDSEIVVGSGGGPNGLGDAGEGEGVEQKDFGAFGGETHMIEEWFDGDDGVASAVVDDVLKLFLFEEEVEGDDSFAEHPGGEGGDGESAAGGYENADGLAFDFGREVSGEVGRGDEEFDRFVRAAVVDNGDATRIGKATPDDRPMNRHENLRSRQSKGEWMAGWRAGNRMAGGSALAEYANTLEGGVLEESGPEKAVLGESRAWRKLA